MARAFLQGGASRSRGRLKRTLRHRPSFPLEDLSKKLHGASGLPVWACNLSLLSATYWGITIADLLVIFRMIPSPIRLGPRPSDVGFLIHPNLSVALAAVTILYAIVMVAQAGTLLCNRAMNNLRAEVKTLTSYDARSWFESSSYFRYWFWPTIILWLVISTISVYTGALSPHTPNVELTVLGVFVAALGIGPTIFAASFLGYSIARLLLSVRKISGKLDSRLNLTSFSLDRRLGLRPFAVATLRMTAIYEMLVLALVILLFSSVALGLQPLSSISPSQIGVLLELGLIGIIIFFAPLIRLRKVMIRTRKGFQDQINIARANVLNPFTENGRVNLDDATHRDLLTLKEYEVLVQRVPNWPFYWGQLIKMGLVLAPSGLVLLLQQGGIWALLNLLSKLLGI